MEPKRCFVAPLRAMVYRFTDTGEVLGGRPRAAVRQLRRAEAEHGERWRSRFVRPTVWVLAMTGVLNLAALIDGLEPREPMTTPAVAIAVAPPRAEPAPTSVAAPAPALDLAAAPAETPVATTPPPPAAVTSSGDIPMATVPPVPQPAPRKGPIPFGRGMWIWQPEYAEGGDVNAIVQRAVATGLTHLYVRTGSSVQGFHGQPFLDQILPAAHNAGLRVYGWDFPTFWDIGADLERAAVAIGYTTPDGHRIDGFVPDIETQSEGTQVSAENVTAYGEGLRAIVGPAYPLVVCVPRPSEIMIGGRFPYAEAVAYFDAIAPMVYWLNRQPDADVAGAIQYLSQFGKPIIPVGQAYDGAPEGGRPGPPPADEIQRFLATAEAHGAVGVSFWSWQHASEEIWSTIATAPQFTLPAGPVVNLTQTQVRSLQILLSQLGYAVSPTGIWDATSAAALMMFQADTGILPNGMLDDLTRGRLLAPMLSPLLGG